MAATGDASSFEKLNVTREEVEKITKAMKDEKFRELFKEYVDEISDPKNKALYEQEIAALEADRGNNIRWIKPTPGRVIKTFFTAKPPKQSGLNGEEEIPANVKKVFINICSCPEIDEAKPDEKNPRPKDQRGQGWSIPYSLTAGRFDVDKAGAKCYVYDCVFNPKTFEMGCKIPKFMELLLTTAIEGIERQFSVKLDHAFKPVKMSYKGEIKATVVRTKLDPLAAKLNNQEGTEKTSLDFIEKIKSQQSQQAAKPAARAPPPTKTIITGNRYKATTAAAEEPTLTNLPETTTPQTKEPTLLPQASVSKRPLIEELPQSSKTESSKENTSVAPSAPPPLKTPTYTLTHRASLSYSNYLASRDRSLTNPPRPDALILKVELPLCDNGVSNLSLNIVENGWKCHVLLPGKYELHVDLPFEVIEKDGTAQFDRGTRVLVVEVPCVPAPVESLPEVEAPFEANEETEEAPQNNADNDNNTDNEAKTVSNSAPSTTDKKEKAEETTFTPCSENETQNAPETVCFEQNLELQQDGSATIPLESKTGSCVQEIQEEAESTDSSNLIHRDDKVDGGVHLVSPAVAINATEEPLPNDLNQLEESAPPTTLFTAESNSTEKEQVKTTTTTTATAEDSDMEEDLLSALKNMKPAQPTEDELLQLADSAKKAGVLTSAEPLWKVESVDKVLSIPTWTQPSEIPTAAEVNGTGREVKLLSHLIYELDD
ncbi:pre-RNA processing PIH1/Nop17-domain-containing protein [Obelidium mucronatum]|nr:pre-RNA processing PIH1/Nop17-domain-containing protein [Obelidium mucronatum]